MKKLFQNREKWRVKQGNFIKSRTSHRCSIKKAVLKNFAIFSGKHPAFLIEHLQWVLLQVEFENLPKTGRLYDLTGRRKKMNQSWQVRISV